MIESIVLYGHVDFCFSYCFKLLHSFLSAICTDYRYQFNKYSHQYHSKRLFAVSLFNNIHIDIALRSWVSTQLPSTHIPWSGYVYWITPNFLYFRLILLSEATVRVCAVIRFWRLMLLDYGYWTFMNKYSRVQWSVLTKHNMC